MVALGGRVVVATCWLVDTEFACMVSTTKYSPILSERWGSFASTLQSALELFRYGTGLEVLHVGRFLVYGSVCRVSNGYTYPEKVEMYRYLSCLCLPNEVESLGVVSRFSRRSHPIFYSLFLKRVCGAQRGKTCRCCLVHVECAPC